jgi:hypothetical protein
MEIQLPEWVTNTEIGNNQTKSDYSMSQEEEDYYALQLGKFFVTTSIISISSVLAVVVVIKRLQIWYDLKKKNQKYYFKKKIVVEHVETDGRVSNQVLITLFAK